MAIFRLHGRDVVSNLAFEQWLFERGLSHQISLLLWQNHPCVVIGRNQNPWIECDMRALTLGNSNLEPVLTRRFSGGGTVYHDLGCSIFSVMVPKDQFQRDYYSHMVIRALKRLNIPLTSGLYVGPRHDIFLQKSSNTAFSSKISGSAFRIGKYRAYHHGTLLLHSNLDTLKRLLTSPLPRDWAQEGASVSSVISPVVNLNDIIDNGPDLNHELFSQVMIDEFRQGDINIPVYEVSAESLTSFKSQSEELLDGWMDETLQLLQSEAWILDKTPPFTLSPPTLGRIKVESGHIVEAEMANLIGTRFNLALFQEILQQYRLRSVE